MTELEIKSKLREIIIDITEIEDFQDDEDLIHDLGVDSMMTIELIARVEKMFKVKISENYLPRFSDLNGVTEVIKEIQGMSA